MFAAKQTNVRSMTTIGTSNLVLKMIIVLSSVTNRHHVHD